MTPCQQYRGRLRAYIDNELTGNEKKNIENHMNECPDCEGHISEVSSLCHALKNLTPATTSENFHILLRERLRREMAGKHRKNPTQFIRWAPVFVVVVIAGLFILRQNQQPSPVTTSRELAKVKPVQMSKPTPTNTPVQYVDDKLKPSSVPFIAVRSEQNVDHVKRDSIVKQNNLQHIRRHVQTVSF